MIVLIRDAYAGELDIDDIAFFEVDDLVACARQGHCIGGEEVFTLTHADHQRTTLTRTDDSLRFILAKHGDGESAMQLLDSPLHGMQQITIV